jgi:hypothetical protein
LRCADDDGRFPAGYDFVGFVLVDDVIERICGTDEGAYVRADYGRAVERPHPTRRG